MSNLTARTISAGIVVPMFYCIFLQRQKRENKERELKGLLKTAAPLWRWHGWKIPDDESGVSGFNKLHRAGAEYIRHTALPITGTFAEACNWQNAGFYSGHLWANGTKKQYPLATLNLIRLKGCLHQDCECGNRNTGTGEFDFIVMGW